ncbi:MAG: hypothetical protein AAGU11_17550 [Syntrophobacteraceae bacterium]
MSERIRNLGRRLELREQLREAVMEMEDCRRLIREMLPPGGDPLKVDGARVAALASRLYGIQLRLDKDVFPELHALNEELGE